MLDAVTAVFIYQNEVFAIRRQPHLRVFPGFHAFPGGKVDAADENCEFNHPLLPDKMPAAIIGALIRELQEELNWDLKQGIETGEVSRIIQFGIAETPDFYPLRFRTHFFRIDLNQRIGFAVDSGEVQWSDWVDHNVLYQRYLDGQALMVLPTHFIVQALATDINTREVRPFVLDYDPDTSLPYMEMMHDLGFIPVPSNTLPPADKTNALHFGDRDVCRVLVDPSPKDQTTLKRLLATLELYPVDKIFLSHHHPDHHEFAPQIAATLGVPILCSETSQTNLLTKFGSDYLDGIEIKLLRHGDTITHWLGQAVHCHALPGHDNGMLGLAPESFSWFFVADLVEPGTTVVIPEDVGNMREYFATLDYVIKVNPMSIFPSHGIPMGGCHLIKQTLAHRQQRESEIRALLANGENEDAIVEALYPDLQRRLVPLARQNIRQHIRKLETE